MDILSIVQEVRASAPIDQHILILQKGQPDEVDSMVITKEELIMRTDNEHDTLLHIAVRTKTPEMVQAILRKYDMYPDIRIQTLHNKDGDTPFHLAVRLGRDSIVDIFLSRPIPVNAYWNFETLNPAYTAIEVDNRPMFQKLLPHVPLDSSLNKVNRSLIDHIAYIGRIDIAEDLFYYALSNQTTLDLSRTIHNALLGFNRSRNTHEVYQDMIHLLARHRAKPSAESKRANDRLPIGSRFSFNPKKK